MAGVVPETEHTYLQQSLLGISWRRGAPLMLLVVGEFLTGVVMRGFEAYLSTIIALAFFVPMVMATGGGTGIQTATLIVRALSTGEVRLRDFGRVMGREIAVCLVLGVFLGGFAALLAWALVHYGGIPVGDVTQLPLKMALTVSVTLILVMLLSVLTGVIMPMAIRAMNFDPAFMTSPLLSTTVDALGLLVYFTVARTIFQL